MTLRSRRTLTIGILIALLVWAMPMGAHAAGGVAGLLGIGEIAAEAVLTLMRDLLDLIHKILLSIISGIGDILQAVVSLKVSTGGPPVYTVWRILRDFCNMAFIIALIFMAFGTIFDSFSIPFLKAFSINSRGVISGFLIAAFMLNFSLAIGQVVVATSNQLSSIVLNVFPENVGASIAQAVNIAQTNISTIVQTKTPAVPDNVPAAGLTPNQQKAISLVPAAVKTQFEVCLKNNTDTPWNCYNRIILPAMDTMNAAAQGRIANQPVLSFNIFAGAKCLAGGSCAIAQPALKPWDIFKMIVEKLWLIFLSVVLAMSMLLVLVFMLVRIPALWVLLALSPLAWTSKAFPGTSGFSEWWKQFMAWNIFSPLYLFVLYLGVILINKTSQLMGSLVGQDGGVPTILGFLGPVFSYGMVGLVFIGGTMQALKMSFAGGSYAKDLVDKVSGGLGMSGKFGAAAPAARFINRLTGAGATYDTLKATAVARGQKLAQVGRGIAERSRFAQMVKPVTYEEKLASMRGRMGVAGGAKEYSELKAGQVTAAQKALGDQTSGMEKATKLTYLKGRMNSADRNVALAAREELLKMNALDDAEIAKTRIMYDKVGGAGAARAFDDRAKRAPGAAAIAKQKEQETERAETVASIRGKITGVDAAADKKVVKDQLGPILDKLADPNTPADKRSTLRKDLKAAEEAISGKDPMLLKEYLDARNTATPNSEANVEARAFAGIVKDPTRILDLPPKYTAAGPEMTALQGAISSTYATPKAKAQLKQKLINADPTRINEIKSLIP